MDNETVLQQFEQIEQKVERIIAVCKSLETTNSELSNKIERLESALQAKNEEIDKYLKEKDQVRSKIDSLLVKLGDCGEGQY